MCFFTCSQVDEEDVARTPASSEVVSQLPRAASPSLQTVSTSTIPPALPREALSQAPLLMPQVRLPKAWIMLIVPNMPEARWPCESLPPNGLLTTSVDA